MNNITIIIFGMAIATYIPRVLPFYMVSKKDLPSKIESFLSFIPYAALGALIFPGVFTSVAQSSIVSIIGISFAFIYSWVKGGIVVPVIGSITTVYLILYGMSI